MLDLEELTEFFTVILIILVISTVIALAWRSTYVGNEQLVTTALVFLNQDPFVPQSTTTSQRSDSDASMDSNASSESASVSTEASQNSQPNQTAADNCVTCDINDQQEQTEVVNDEQNESETDSPINNDDGNIQDSESRLGATALPQSVRKRIVNQPPEKSELNNSSGVEEVTPKNSTNPKSSQTVDSIEIKLKFLDDTQRFVRGLLTDDVGSFKRANFGTELSANCAVRLIFNGRLLNEDSWTLRQYGFFDKCVVHCHISQQQSSPAARGQRSSMEQSTSLDLSGILNPLLFVIVIFLWYLRYQFSYIFNDSATIFLAVLSILFVVFQYALVISFNLSVSIETTEIDAEGSDRRRTETVRLTATEPSQPPSPEPRTTNLSSDVENLSGGCRLASSSAAIGDVGAVRRPRPGPDDWTAAETDARTSS